MKFWTILFVSAVALAATATAAPTDISGRWTASFDTQIGTQNYTYDFKVDGAKLTGTARSQFGQTAISEGMVKGDEISFVENLLFEGQPLRIVYKGKISGDEIRFTRNVANTVSEQLVAKRVK